MIINRLFLSLFATLLVGSLHASATLSSPLHTPDKYSDSRTVEDVFGHIFAKLSQAYTIQGKTTDVMTIITANTSLDTPDHHQPEASGPRTYKELLPSKNGVILRIYGPFPKDPSQHLWATSHSPAAHTFSIAIQLPDDQFIGIDGNYGESFPTGIVDDLLSLSQEAK